MSVLVGKKAPDFTVAAVNGSGEIVDQYNFAEAIEGKYAVLFFYPLDFTFVCPSELIALDNRMEEFRKRNVEVVAVSIDSQFSHLKYRNTSRTEGGIGPVQYTLAADVSHKICQAYDVEHPQASVAFRGAFMIDKNGVVRSQTVNDLPIGRDIDELLRVIDAIQFTDEHGEVCPAGWKKGEQAMKPSTEGMTSFLAEHSDKL
jgi:peroxiredoxin (alkyl hydroperoxide reductase subunit C)